MATGGGTNKLTLRLEVQDDGAVRVVRALREELEGLSRAAREANREVGGAGTTMGRVARSTGSAATAMRNFAAHGGNAAAAMQRVMAAGGGGGANNMGRGMTAAAASGRNLSSVLRDISIHTIAINSAWSIMQRVGGAVVSVLKMATEEGAKFEQHLANVSTLYYGYLDSAYAVSTFGSAIKDMLGVVPKSADDLGASAYEIVQAGITDTAKAVEILRRGVELGVAGMGSTKSSVDILTSAMNAYGFAVEEVSKLSNTLFLTVQYGKTTIDDLVESFGRAAPIAQAAGVRIEELSAATAAMTQAGMRTTDAQIYVRQTVNSLLKPTQTMQVLLDRVAAAHDNMGAATGRNLVKTFGFIGSLLKLKDAAEGSDEVLSKAYGRIQANTLQLALTGARLQSYVFILGQMDENTRALNDAYLKAGDTWTRAVERLASSWDKVKITFFETFKDFGPAFIYEIRDALVDLADSIPKLNDPMLNFATVTLPKLIENFAAVIKLALQWGPTILKIGTIVTGAGLAGAASGGNPFVALMGGGAAAMAAQSIPSFSQEQIDTMFAGIDDIVAGGKEAAAKLLKSANEVAKARSEAEEIAMRSRNARVDNRLDPNANKTAFPNYSGPASEIIDPFATVPLFPVVGGPQNSTEALRDAALRLAQKNGGMTPLIASEVAKTGLVPEGTIATKMAFDGEDVGESPAEKAEALNDVLKEIGKTYDDRITKQEEVARLAKAEYQFAEDSGASKERLKELSNTEVAAARAVHDERRAMYEEQLREIESAITHGDVLRSSRADEIALLNTRIEAEKRYGEIAGKTAADIAKSNKEAAKASEKVDHKVEREMWQARMDVAKSTVDLRKQEFEALERTKAPLDQQRAAAAAVDAAVRSQLQVEIQILDYKIAQTKASGADAALTNQKVQALLAEKAVLDQRANTYSDATNELNQSIDSSIEKITFDLPTAFRDGMRESIAAVVSGTRDMSDVFEGLKTSIIGSFTDAFIGVIVGKKSKLDDPMQQNINGIGGLFERLGSGVQSIFGGIFDFVSSGFSMFSNSMSGISGLGQSGIPLMSAQNGAGGVGMAGNAASGAATLFNSSALGAGTAVAGMGGWLGGKIAGKYGQYGGFAGGMVGAGMGAMAAGTTSTMIGAGLATSIANSAAVASVAMGAATAASSAATAAGASAASAASVAASTASTVATAAVGAAFAGIGVIIGVVLGVLLQKIMGKPSQRSLAKKMVDGILTNMLLKAFPNRLDWEEKEAQKDIIRRKDIVDFTRREAAGLEPGGITAQTLGLLFAGMIPKKENPFKGKTKTFSLADVAGGQIQDLFDRYGEDVDKFALAMAEGLAGGIETAINAVQRSINKVTKELRAFDGYLDAEGSPSRIGGFFGTMGGKNYIETEIEAYERLVSEGIIPSMEEAVTEIVRIFGQKLPRAIRDRFDDVVSREFALEARRRVGTPAENEIVRVDGQQIARLIEIETEAFSKLAEALTSISAKIKDDALSRKQSTDLLASEIRKIALEKGAEKIGTAFFSSAAFDNLFAPLFTTLERGVEEVLAASSAEEAGTLMSNLLRGVGNDFLLIQQNMEKLLPIMEAYNKLIDDMTLAMTSFRDVSRMADDAVEAIRKMKRTLMEDQAAILAAEAKDGEETLRRRLRTLAKKTGLELFGADGDVIRRSRGDIEAIVAAMTDDELKRAPDLLMAIANQIVSNANLQIQALEEQLKIAQEWASLNDSSRDAMLAVRQYGRPAGETAEATFNLARNRFERLVTQFRTGTESEQLSAAQQIVQAGPALLELARNAGFEPGSSVFELLRGGISAVLEDTNRRAFDAQAEVLTIQKQIKEVQDKALAELTSINKHLAVVEQEALSRRDQEKDWEAFIGPTGPVQTTADTAVKTYGLLNEGINVADVSKEKYMFEDRPLNPSSASSFRYESPREIGSQAPVGGQEAPSLQMPITFVEAVDKTPETEKVRQLTRMLLKALDDPRVKRKMRATVSGGVAANG